MAATFQETFKSVLSVHAPVKKRRAGPYFALWLASGLRTSIETRDTVVKIGAKSPEIWPADTKQRKSMLH